MPAKMLNVFPTIWKQIRARKIPWVPKLTAAEQTKLTWAKLIESYDAVPKVYQDFFKPFLVNRQVFPYTILTPTRESFVDRTTEKLICDHGQEIHVLERSGDSYEAKCYPVEGINHIELRTILLDTRVKISGKTKQGGFASSVISFNSVTDFLFLPILNRMRLATVDYKEAVQSSELEKFDHLIRTNFKFMNYAKRSLLAGDRVIHSILQPEIREPNFRIFGRTFYKTISPTHISILTDRELITIRESEIRSGTGKYGGIWDYTPVNKVISLTLNNRNDDGLLILSVQLPENVRLDYLFQPSAKQELDQLLDRFAELTATA